MTYVSGCQFKYKIFGYYNGDSCHSHTTRLTSVNSTLLTVVYLIALTVLIKSDKYSDN